MCLPFMMPEPTSPNGNSAGQRCSTSTMYLAISISDDLERLRVCMYGVCIIEVVRCTRSSTIKIIQARLLLNQYIAICIAATPNAGDMHTDRTDGGRVLMIVGLQFAARGTRRWFDKISFHKTTHTVLTDLESGWIRPRHWPPGAFLWCHQLLFKPLPTDANWDGSSTSPT